MTFLKNFHNKILKQELINKFKYKQLQNIPKLKKIILSFNCKTSELQNVTINLLALKLISKQKSALIQAKQQNINLKINKGEPVGCKVTIRKKSMFKFIKKIITEIFSRPKNFQKFKSENINHTFSYQIENVFNLQELKQHYYIFSNLSKLDIIIVSNAKTNEEMLFILKSLQVNN